MYPDVPRGIAAFLEAPEDILQVVALRVKPRVCDLVPIERRGNGGAGNGTERIRCNGSLREGIAHDVQKQPSMPRILARFHGDTVGKLVGDLFGDTGCE